MFAIIEELIAIVNHCKKMKKELTHIEKSFRIGIVILLLIAIAFLSIMFKAEQEISSAELLIGLPILLAGILGIVGIRQAIKGRKETFSLKKIFAFIVSTGIVIVLIGLLIANAIDILRAFN